LPDAALIDNHSQNYLESPPLRLTALARNQPAYVDTVDWEAMSASDGRRLRELGLCEGASIELLHRAGFTGRGAYACRVGRMTIAMRAAHADAIAVRTGPSASESEDTRASGVDAAS
jgi:ferrous iron transport protein A